MEISRRRAVATALLALVVAASASRSADARPATEVGGEIPSDTVWALADSPYVTTAKVVVPAGVRLTIEPGVVVRMAPSHEIQVHGALRAVGTEQAPIVVRSTSESMNWGTIALLADSGPNEIAHAQITGGGSLRRALVTIATDDAIVRDSMLRGSQGIGMEIRDGKSPTVQRCKFDLVTDGSANPPAALRILGPSDAVIVDNYFQSNFQAVNWQADASPRFTGNRFDYNGMDGVVVTGTANRAVRWPNLGPRDWSYFLMGTGVTVAPSGTLTIDPGATLRMFTGAALRVEGGLQARGTAVSKILFTTQSAEPKPGQWQEIAFTDTSQDYDPVTGEGSVLEHTLIEYGGSSTGRALYIRDSSPRIANTVIRHSGARAIAVAGTGAAPELIGMLVEQNRNDPDGIGLLAQLGAAPRVSFTVFRENFVGLRAESGMVGRIGPHNSFDRNLSFGAENHDPLVCVDATGNDWSASNGPQDLSGEPDVCGQIEHLGDGDMVTDAIDYLPFEGTLPLPVMEQPRCGSTSDTQPVLAGLAPPRAEVVVYDNQVEIGRTFADEGQEGVATYRFTPTALAAGSHVFQVQMVEGEQASTLSEPLDVYIDPDLWLDPAHIVVRYDLEGTHYVQPYFHYVGDKGCQALRDDNGWQVRPHPGAPLTLEARLACPGGATPSASLHYLDAATPMSNLTGDLYAATFEMGAGGAFDVEVTCGARTREFHVGNIVGEFEGLLYDEVRGVLVRVQQAQVTLEEYDLETDAWAIWRGDAFYGQTNPQTTGPAGWYGFYPPPGRYRVRAEAEHYRPYVSEPVDVVEQPVMLSIGMWPEALALHLPVLHRRH